MLGHRNMKKQKRKKKPQRNTIDLNQKEIIKIPDKGFKTFIFHKFGEIQKNSEKKKIQRKHKNNSGYE